MPKSILVFAAILLLFNFSAIYPQQASRSSAVEDFELEGVALFQCQCTAHACPCQKNGAPTHGTCEAADFAHITIGRYGKVRLHRAWDHSGGYANIKYFHLTKKMYDNKEMLGQFGDFSGHWTPEQLAIIHRQGMPE
jgi:uncharacterized protein DUF1326